MTIQVMISMQFTRGKCGKSDLHVDFVCTFFFFFLFFVVVFFVVVVVVVVFPY